MTPRQVRDARATDHAALEQALASHEGHIPCRTGTPATTAAWTSDDLDEQEVAARACWPCPALAACAAYAELHPAELGVYAGRTERDRRPLGRPRTTTRRSEAA